MIRKASISNNKQHAQINKNFATTKQTLINAWKNNTSTPTSSIKISFKISRVM